MWTQCLLTCSPPPSLATFAPTCTKPTSRLRYNSLYYWSVLMAWPVKPAPLHLVMHALQSPAQAISQVLCLILSTLYQKHTAGIIAGGRLAASCRLSGTFFLPLQQVRKQTTLNCRRFKWQFCRDREEWFPGREWTASRLKERGKDLVVDLQEIVT